jgi:hypothetical protein
VGDVVHPTDFPYLYVVLHTSRFERVMVARQGRKAMIRSRVLHAWLVQVTQGSIALSGVGVMWIVILGNRVERLGLTPFVPLVVYGFMGACLLGVVLIAAGPPQIMPASRGMVARDRPRYELWAPLPPGRSPPWLPGS